MSLQFKMPLHWLLAYKSQCHKTKNVMELINYLVILGMPFKSPWAALQACVPHKTWCVHSLDSLFLRDTFTACYLSLYFIIIRNHCGVYDNFWYLPEWISTESSKRGQIWLLFSPSPTSWKSSRSVNLVFLLFLLVQGYSIRRGLGYVRWSLSTCLGTPSYRLQLCN